MTTRYVRMLRAALALSATGCAPESLLWIERPDDNRPDAGSEAYDASSPPDGGDSRDGGSADAGAYSEPRDAGCAFEGPELVPFVPDGSEDFVSSANLAEAPDLDLIATWSHVDGDEFVIDLRFVAAPFHTPRNALVHIGFFSAGEPGLLCAQQSAMRNCSHPTSQGVFGDDYPDRSGWPPELLLLRPDVHSQVLGDACTALAAPVDGAPLLRAKFPLALAATEEGTPPEYVVLVSGTGACPEAADTGEPSCEVTWQSPDDRILSRGGVPPLVEFASVCSTGCGELQD